MESHVSHNNDRKYYRIAIDTAKEGDQIFNLTEYFKGRVGDRNYGLQMTWYEQGSLKNVKGLKPYIDGNVGHYSIGDDGEIIMAPDASVVSYVGAPSDTDVAGRAVYHFPEQMFPQEGIFYGFIGLIDDSDGDQRLSGVNVWFKVLPGVAYMGKASAYYIGEIDKLIHNSEERIRQLLDQGQKDVDAKQAALQAIVDDYKAKMSDLIDRLNAQGQTANSMMETVKAGLSALETKIQQDDLFTGAEAQQLKQDVAAKIALAIVTYPTIEAMVADTDLMVGMTVRTLRASSNSNGDGYLYTVTDDPGNDGIQLKNGLYAKPNGTQRIGYYSSTDITYKNTYENSTNVYAFSIAKTDEEGNPIRPYVDENKSFHAKSPADYASKARTSLTTNAGLTVPVSKKTGKFVRLDKLGPDEGYDWVQGTVISKGKEIRTLPSDVTASLPGYMRYVGFKDDGSIVDYIANQTTGTTMINDGVKDAFLVYWKLVENGQTCDMSGIVPSEGEVAGKDSYPSIAVGEMNDGRYGIVACDGRTIYDAGMTLTEFAQYLKKIGFKNAWNIDGGGSTSVSLYGRKINKNIDRDDNGYDLDRGIDITLSFAKANNYDSLLSNVYSQISAAKNELIRQFSKPIYMYNGMARKFAFDVTVTSDEDLMRVINLLPHYVKYPVLAGGGSVEGFIRLMYNNSAIFKPTGITDRQGKYRFEYSFGPGAIPLPGNESKGGIGFLKLTSLYQFEEQFVNEYDYRTGQWQGWHVLNAAHGVEFKIESPGVILANVNQSYSGLVVADIRVNETIGNNWTKLISGLPKRKATPNTQSTGVAIDTDGTAFNLVISMNEDCVWGKWNQFNLNVKRAITTQIVYPTMEPHYYNDFKL